jgi:protein SCO1
VPRLTAFLLLLTLGAAVRPAGAQVPGQVTPGTEGVGLVERLGQGMPQDLAFTDDAGRAVTLGQYFGQGKPVVLMLVYYNCPMLCNLLLDGYTKAAAQIPGTPGEDYTVVTVSFNPAETTAQAQRQKARNVAALGRPDAAQGWHFLTGTQANILALADAVGFRYRWEERAQQYAHPAALIFASPEGTITRYLPGLSYEPRDLRFALNEASDGKVGTVIDSFLMLCYQYDPETGSYAPVAARIMQVGGALFVLAFGLVVALLWRRDHTEPPLPPSFSPDGPLPA